MIQPRWHKVIRDFGSNKLRTVLVVLSIAVGVFSVGMVMGTSGILFRELQKGYKAIVPLEASVPSDPFEPEMLETIRRIPGIREVEGRAFVNIRVKTGPDEWTQLQLSAVDDYENIHVNKVFPRAGAWPPPKRELLIERGSLPKFKAQVGDMVTIEGPDNKERQMRIAGTVYDTNLPPPSFVPNGFGYISMDTLEWLGLPRTFNNVQITVADDNLNKQHISDVAAQVKAKIEKGGRKVYDIYVPTPGEHPAESALKPIMLVLTVMGFLSLILSGLLVVNTINAIMAQQVRQIGMMKAVGGRNRQLLGIYLATVIIFGLLSLAVAVPLGALAARTFSNALAVWMGYEMYSYMMPTDVIITMIAIGLIAPILAALYPVLSGTRMSVREAINNYGIQGKRRRGRIARLVAGIFPARPAARARKPLFSRPLLLSLRNTFRRKGRLALTLTTLTLAGALFMGLFSVRESMTRSLDEALQYWKYDLEMQFSRPYRADEIETLASQVPGVESVESWGYMSTNRVRANDVQGDALVIVAPPADTRLIQPVILEGRWLQPGDENAIVVNTEVLKVEPDIKVGHDIILKIDGRDESWRVVGIAKGLMTGRMVYANYPYFGRVTRSVGRAFTAEVVTSRHDAAFEDQVAKALERQFKNAGMRVSSWETISTVRARVDGMFQIVLIFLLVMVVLLAVVGGLGLMGTMSMNVLERTREIGVLRAIGAGNPSVLELVVVEGVVIGLLSWTFGLVLAYPLSMLLADAMGQAMMQAPLSYAFSLTGPAAWLAVVVVLASLASLLPARNAARMSVREALAYE